MTRKPTTETELLLAGPVHDEERADAMETRVSELESALAARDKRIAELDADLAAARNRADTVFGLIPVRQMSTCGAQNVDANGSAAVQTEQATPDHVPITVHVSPDNEGTAHPWWAIVDPRQLMSPSGQYAHMVTGPFFSRAEAEAALNGRRHRFGKHAAVCRMSGHMTDEYARQCRDARLW